jgi:hypothetical protein
LDDKNGLVFPLDEIQEIKIGFLSAVVFIVFKTVWPKSREKHLYKCPFQLLISQKLAFPELSLALLGDLFRTQSRPFDYMDIATPCIFMPILGTCFFAFQHNLGTFCHCKWSMLVWILTP